MSPPADPSSPAGPGRRRLLAVIVVGALFVVVWLGACHLSFLCDDAFITFRYVSNAMDGRGLVWNPSPFAPVEGYTGFSWLVLLWAVWSWFGVEPPDSVNVLSIGCGLLTFAITAATALRMRGRDGRRLPAVLVFVTLAAIASNRTFLLWLTSGLETALFDLAVVAWVLLAFRSSARRGAAWLAAWSGCAALAALTRPDGLLLVAATVVAAVLAIVRRQLRAGGMAAGLAPLLAVAGHVAWRRSFYGEFVPNTYFAKVGDPWPAAGIRHVVLFLMENGGWLWWPLACVWLLVELRRGAAAAVRAVTANVPAIAAVATTLVGTGYYVFVVGGDHFEYRIYAHLVPLGGLAAAAMAARIARGVVLPVAVVAAIGVAAGVAWWIPAVQPTTTFLYEPLAPHVPGFVQPFARWYDRHRAWLSLQAVGVRVDQHRAFLSSEMARLPERARGKFDSDDVPVHAAECVGMLGWVLPDVAILDLLGLNDRVVARSPLPPDARAGDEVVRLLTGADADRDGVVTRAELRTAAESAGGGKAASAFTEQIEVIFGDREGALRSSEIGTIAAFFGGLRRMAHERRAPEGYVAALAANVEIAQRRVVITPRPVALGPSAVRAIESEWYGRSTRWPR